MGSVSSTVSVIIPMWNAASTIGRALESLALQTRTPDEVVVVDNASTDNSVTEAEKFRDCLPLKVVRNEIPGSGATRNAGIASSSNSLLTFLDADDVWYPAKLEMQLDAVSHLERPFAGTYMHYLTPTGAVLGNNVRYVEGNEASIALRSASALPASLSSILVGRELVQQVGAFNPSFRRAQDFEWLVRVAQVADLVIPTPEPQVGYVLSSGTSTDDSYIEQAMAADEVRQALRENRDPDYAANVVPRAAAAGANRRYRAGALYRRAGVRAGQKRYLEAMTFMVCAGLLDPVGVLEKIKWQSVGKDAGAPPEEISRLFESGAQ